MTTEPLHHTFIRLIKAIGIWTSICLTLCVLILAFTYIRIGNIVNDDALQLVHVSGRQRMLAETITKDALAIELALRTKDWDSFDPTLARLSANRKDWQESHESLSTNKQNKFSTEHGQWSIQDYFSRIEFPYSQLVQAIDEIEVVTRSVIRRAPYIDARSHDRIVAAARTLQANSPEFQSNMNEIVKLYELNASRNSTQAVWSVHMSLLFLLATLTVTFVIGIAPRYWHLVAQNIRLTNDINRASEAANKRWHFLASLGHEFRTPMSSIMGFAGLLANEDQDAATKKQHANSILGPSQGLLALIEDIIDMSAIEANELQVFPKLTDPRNILNKIEATFKEQAQEKGLEFRTFLDESCPASITTDNIRLEQILSRVIDNAIKFSKAGSVEIHAALETVDNKEMFVVRIVDTGIGIEFKDINRIFEPFERIESGMTREYQGAGLGLTVAHALTRRLGGNLTIKSAIGAGSFVTIAIDPGQYTTQSDSPQETAEQISIDLSILESKHILIVEDGQDSQRLLSHYLTKAGCSIHLADNGQIGIDRFMAAIDSKTPIDLILMDMQMPIMDGFEATAILREENATIPILGVTAYSSEDDRKRCLNAGCDEHLAKPVKKTLLLDTCAHWLAKHATENQDNNQQPKHAA